MLLKEVVQNHSSELASHLQLKSYSMNLCWQEITQKWEKLRHPEIASKERTQVVREILDMVCSW